MTIDDYNNMIKAQQSVIDKSIVFLNDINHSAYEVAVIVKGLEQLDLVNPYNNASLMDALNNRLQEIGTRENLTAKDLMYLSRATINNFAYKNDCNLNDGSNFDINGYITIGERRFEDFDDKILETFYNI